MTETTLFYLFAAVAVVASLLVIAQRNPIYSVLLLIASFGALSGLYVLLEAPFVAVIQIIVYAGVINVITKTPWDESGATVAVRSGSQNLVDVGARVAGLVKDDFGWKVNGQF